MPSAASLGIELSTKGSLKAAAKSLLVCMGLGPFSLLLFAFFILTGGPEQVKELVRSRKATA